MAIHRIFIGGESMYLAALEAGLRQQSDVVVWRFDPHRPTASSYLLRERPSLVIVDTIALQPTRFGSQSNAMMLALVLAQIPLLLIDFASQSGTLLSGERVSIADSITSIQLLLNENKVDRIVKAP